MIHEGIGTLQIAPRPGASMTLHRAGLTFQPRDEVVSFVARNLEPYRGFHHFMRMLPRLQALRPNAHVVIMAATESVTARLRHRRQLEVGAVAGAAWPAESGSHPLCE